MYWFLFSDKYQRVISIIFKGLKMKAKLSSIFFLSCLVSNLYASDTYQLTLVDTTIDGLVRANSICDQYLNIQQNEYTRKVDGLALRSVQAWKKKNNETGAQSLLLKIALLPTRCIEVAQETPTPPFKKGFLLNNDGKLGDPIFPNGIIPDPNDFVVGVAGTRGMVAVQIVNKKRTNNYYGPYATSKYTYDDELKMWVVNLEWKMKDIMSGHEYRSIYGKKGKDLNIFIPMAYCPENFAESQYRPRIDANDTAKWDRLFYVDENGKKNFKPSRCITFPQPIKINLNVDLDNTNTPLPPAVGKFLAFKESYEKSVIPSNEERAALNGQLLGKCYDRRDPNVAIPAILAGLLSVGGPNSEARLQIKHIINPPKDKGEIDKIITSAFSLNGNVSMIENNAFKTYEGDLRTSHIRKSENGFFLKVEDTIEVGKFKFEKNEVRFCEFNKK